MALPENGFFGGVNKIINDATNSANQAGVASGTAIPDNFKAGFVANAGVIGIDLDATENPKFDLITSRPSLVQNRTVERGVLWLSKPGEHSVILHFLYNPTRYSLQYAMNDQVVPAIYLPNPATNGGVAPAPNLITGISLSFDMLLDRVAESWKDANHPGVLVDLAVLEKVSGVTEAGVLNSYPVYLFFATGYLGEIFSNAASAPKFYGVITSIGIDFTLFNRNMVPTQCIVHITMEQRYLTQGIDMSNQGTDSSATGAGTDSGSTDSGATGATPNVRNK